MQSEQRSEVSNYWQDGGAQTTKFGEHIKDSVILNVVYALSEIKVNI